MLYFKNSAPPYESLDGRQFDQVKEFKEKVAAMGGYYREFGDADEFERLARNHLTQLVLDFSKGGEAALERLGEIETIDESTSGRGEEGLLDIVDEYIVEMASVQILTAELGESTSRLTADMNSAMAEYEQITDLSKPAGARKAKRIFGTLASLMDIYSESVEFKTPLLNSALSNSADALDKAIQIAPEFGAEGITSICSIRPALATLHGVMLDSSNATDSMREIFGDWPPVLSSLNRAKRRSMNALDVLSEALRSATNRLGSTTSLSPRRFAQTFEQ